jgi:hypothetical protein
MGYRAAMTPRQIEVIQAVPIWGQSPGPKVFNVSAPGISLSSAEEIQYDAGQ